MIPIVFVLVYRLERCIQHFNKREILSYLQRQLMVKKNSLEGQEKCS